MTIEDWFYNIIKSVTKHYQAEIAMQTYFTGEKKAEVDEWCEVRFKGPDPVLFPNSTAEFTMVINTLVSTKQSTNIYNQFDKVRKALKAYGKSIPIYDENGDLLLCAQIVSGIEILHFGTEETSVELFRSTIQATYKLEVDYA